MKSVRSARDLSMGPKWGRRRHVDGVAHHGADQGFTLLELLIVIAVMPLIIGGLAVGLISVFSLQSSVSNRLEDTADAQVVEANYQNDVQSAVDVTTDATSSPQCGVGIGTQLLGLESVPNQRSGSFQTLVSYQYVPVTSGSATTYSMERLYCTSSSTTPSNISILAYDLPSPTSSVAPLQPPVIQCAAGASPSVCSSASQQWKSGYVPAAEIATVTLNVTEPHSKYNFNLVASPAASTSFSSGGVASTPAAPCDPTSGSTGPYAGQLCIIDLAGLTANDLKVAMTASQCYNVSVAVQGPYILHFCLSISDTASTQSVGPSAVPTDTDAGFGQSVYPGQWGKPAIYQNPYVSGNPTVTLTLSGIYVINSSTGQLATGWNLVSVEAETINTNESMTWTSNVPMSWLNDTTETTNGHPLDGDACTLSSPSPSTTLTCTGNSGDGVKGIFDGAAMVAAATPATMTVTWNNYDAVAFGMLLP